MAYQATIVTIFISSPGDVKSERQFIIDEIQSWNQRNSEKSGCFLSPRTWEDVVAPDQDQYSQNVINQQIGDSYDVFLGLMWSRFGTPTQAADSGTEEEYDRAIERKNSGTHLNLSFFFKTSDVPMSLIDADQITKVSEFKKKISAAGCFYKEFSEDIHLSRGLNILFDKIARNLEKYPILDGMIAIPADKLVLPSEKQTIPSDNTGASDEDALGLFDLSDMMERTTAAIVVLVSDWGNEIELLGAAMKDSTEQLNNMSKFGQPDQQLVRKKVSQTAEQLDQFAEFGEAKIEEIESEMSEFISTFQGIADVSKDFNSTQDDIDNTAHSIEQLVVGMEGAMDGTRSFADSVAALPRLSKEFNKSRARVVRVQKKFLDLMEQNLRDLLEVKLTVESLLPYAAESD
jgi:hypothetical protein